MSAGFLPGVQTGSTAAAVSAPTTSSGATSTFVKIFCGNDDCVPLSKQCTSGVFQGILADLANRVRRRETEAQRQQKTRRVTAGSAGTATSDVSSSLAQVGNGNIGGDSSGGRAMLPMREEHAGGAGARDGASVGGAGLDPRKRQLVPSIPKSPATESALRGAGCSGRSAGAPQFTAMSPGADAAVVSASDAQTGVDDAGIIRGAEYRRAELLPLSFVRDIASNSKVTSLYKQHLQLQEQVRRYQLEQQQLQKQDDEEEDCAAATATEGSATNNRNTANRGGGGEGKAQAGKVAARRRGVGSGGRSIASSSGGRGASPANTATVSPVAAASLASQIRTQLWAALRNTIPFLGVMTMPAHTTMEPLVSLPNSAPSTGASAASSARPGSSLSTSSSSTGVVSAATAVCSGSYVLLGCRERLREGVVAGDASSMFAPQSPPPSSTATPVIGGTAAHSALLAMERLVEKAREASVARLPSLCADAASRSGTCAPVASVSTSESAKRSTRKPRGHTKDVPVQEVTNSLLPMRCTLQAGTNRVVPLAPPFPEDGVACYGAARLVTKSLDKPASPDGDGEGNSEDGRGGHHRGVPVRSYRPISSDRARQRLLELAAHRSVTAAGASAAGNAEGAGYSSRVAALAGSSKVGRGIASAVSPPTKDGIGGSEVEPATAAQVSTIPAPVSNDSSSSPKLLQPSLPAVPSVHPPGGAGEAPKEADSPIPLSAAVIARLMPSTRFTVQLSSCSVALTVPPRKGAGLNTADIALATSPGAGDTNLDEFSLVFDGLDVLWHGPSGEEALLQWVLDEYSVLLKQRITVAMVQWTSMARTGDASASATGGSSSRTGKSRGPAAPERALA